MYQIFEYIVVTALVVYGVYTIAKPYVKKAKKACGSCTSCNGCSK